MTEEALLGEMLPLPPRPEWLPDEDALTRFFARTVRYSHYRNRVTEYIARLLPEGPCSILDVGAGDGYLGALLQTYRPETFVAGVDVRSRQLFHPRAALAVYDGLSLPFADRSFDVALLTNVLHHADQMLEVLKETCRVARRRIVVKDHLSRGTFDWVRLALLDVLGNRRFGASVTGRYLSADQWAALLRKARCESVRWYGELEFRSGWMAALFENRLEILFSLEVG